MRLLRGTTRKCGKPRKFAKALTTGKLNAAVGHYRTIGSKGFKVGWGDVLMPAAPTTAVYGLLSVGEFASSYVKGQCTEDRLEDGPKKGVHMFDEDLCWSGAKLYYHPPPKP